MMQMADLTRIDDVWDRLQADTDFRAAADYRRSAHLALRWKLPAYRAVHRDLMRSARRAFRRYALQVRKASR